MTTKQRIINQAIESYNSYGLANVTIREIAKILNMSHGNLEYHFNNKEALLLAIYEQMRNDISKVYEAPQFSQNAFYHFNQLLIKLEEFDLKYSFFNLDVLEISRNYSQVGMLLSKTLEKRHEQMEVFFKLFIEQGYFKKELSFSTYPRLLQTVRILITFWNSQKEVLSYFLNVKDNRLSIYIWELLSPHFTNLGLQEYQKISINSTEKV